MILDVHNLQKCIDQVTSAIGNEVPSKTTMCHQFSEFRHVPCSFKDGFKKDRPKSNFVSKNIDAVREIIRQDRM